MKEESAFVPRPRAAPKSARPPVAVEKTLPVPVAEGARAGPVARGEQKRRREKEGEFHSRERAIAFRAGAARLLA